jgi:hypothetical protein
MSELKREHNALEPHGEPMTQGIWVKFNTGSEDRAHDAGKLMRPATLVKEGLDMSTFLTSPLMAELEDQRKLNGLGSLNEGAELDDEEELESPQIFYEVVDDSEALKEIISMEDNIQGLIYVLRDLKTSSGMTQSIALEAHKFIPDFDDNTPIGYYTKMPSATRYKVSMEALHKGIWAAIAAMSAIVIGIIAKIFKYFGDDKKKAEKKLAKAIQVSDDIPVVLSKIGRMVETGDDLLKDAKPKLMDNDGKEFKGDSFDAIIKAYYPHDAHNGSARKFLKATDPVFFDIINNGKYSQAVSSLVKYIGPIDEAINQKLDIVTKMMSMKLYGEGPEKEAFLSSVDKVESLTIRYEGNDMTLLEVSREIARLQREVINSQTTKDINFDRLFGTMSDAFKNKDMGRLLTHIKKSTPLLLKLERKLEDLQQFSRNLGEESSSQYASEEIAHHIRSTVSAIAADIAGLHKLIADITEYATAMETLAIQSVALATSIIRRTMVELHKNKQEIPKEWENLIARVKEQRDIIDSSFFHY